MYDVIADPYCYPGTTVLRNRLNLRDQDDLDAFEADAVTLRGEEPLPSGRFSPRHYCAVHRHLFQDVYRWAGRYRTVRIAKGGSMFCYPEYIGSQMALLFGTLRAADLFRGLTVPEFAGKSADFLTELNAIHPFREGNGRTQLSFFALLADHAGCPVNLSRLEPEMFLAAMIDSFQRTSAPLAVEIQRLTS